MSINDIDNISLFQPNNFRLSIDRTNYPAAEMFCTSVSHPSVSVGAAIAADKRRNVPFPGDTIEFGELSATILVDEDFNSYNEIYAWLLRHVNMKHTTQYTANTSDEIPSVSDIMITALTNHNNKNQQIRYIDAFPTSLGEIQLEAGTGETNVVFPVSFAFAYFELL